MLDLTLDYHAHVLPGCDHGSDGLQTSLAQIAMAREAGVRTICATPHFYPHEQTAAAFLDRRQRCFDELKAHLMPGDPRIIPGAEVLICESMERMEELPALCLQGTEELLLEMPFYAWSDGIWETAFRLKERLHVVIAHADRYRPEDIERLIAEGFDLQLNAQCLNHPLKRRRYLAWIDRGAVSYLGSDIHGTTRGYRDWTKSIRLLGRREKG